VLALLVPDLGAPARLERVAEPVPGPGETLLSVIACPLNPVDLSVAGGRFFAGHPPLPYPPGVELVGRVLRSAAVPEGSVVFSCLDGLGTSRPGACAELAVVRDTALTVLPEGLDPVRAAAIGTPGLAAWYPLTRLTQVTPDDTVVVLGATGAVGKIAIQTAKLRGARSIVGVGRNQARLASARSLGASAVVGLDASVDLPADLRAACEEPPTIVVDPLWGRPLLAALEVAATHARVIQLGQSSAPDLSLPSALVRGKSLQILGYTNLNVPLGTLLEAYGELVTEFALGRIAIEPTVIPLADAERAWIDQSSGPGTKIVVCPS
jgi:NADPH2:quinone reductase